MIDVVICCWDKNVVDTISENIASIYKDSCSLRIYFSYSEFVDNIEKEVYDVVFLDMDYDKCLAFAAAEKFREVDKAAKLIFISRELELVFKSFSYNIFWFIRRNLIKSDLEKMLKYLKKEMLDTPKSITFFTKNGRVYINQQDIVYIEVMSHDTTVHTKTSIYNTNRPLDKLINDLDPFGFIRIHKAFLVNYRDIASIHKYTVILNDSTELPMSKKRKKDVSNRLKTLMKLK